LWANSFLFAGLQPGKKVLNFIAGTGMINAVRSRFLSSRGSREVSLTICVIALLAVRLAAENPAPAKSKPEPVSVTEIEIARAQAWTLLQKAFTSDKASNRVDAVSALSTIPDNASVIKMVESALNDKDPSVRGQAALTLAELGSRASVPKIKPLLKDKNSEVSFAAARALSQLGDNSGRDILIEVLTGERQVSGSFLDSSVSWAKQFTVKNIAFLGAAQSATIFAGPIGAVGVSAIRDLFFNDHSSGVRSTSAQALAPDGSDRAVEILENALHDKSWTVRFSAANALGFAPNPQPIPGLVKLLHDNKFAVRLVSAASIVRLASPAPPPPIESLTDPQPSSVPH
jgi:HEAT repeat protein